MASVEAGDRFYLTRKEAVAFISRHFFSISLATFNRLASAKKGPPFCYTGGDSGRALYPRSDLETWARRRALVVTAPVAKDGVGTGRTVPTR